MFQNSKSEDICGLPCHGGNLWCSEISKYNVNHVTHSATSYHYNKSFVHKSHSNVNLRYMQLVGHQVLLVQLNTNMFESQYIS